VVSEQAQQSPIHSPTSTSEGEGVLAESIRESFGQICQFGCYQIVAQVDRVRVKVSSRFINWLGTPRVKLRADITLTALKVTGQNVAIFRTSCDSSVNKVGRRKAYFCTKGLKFGKPTYVSR